MNFVETKDGTMIKVFVKPNQPRFKITLDGEDIIVLSTEEPVKNRVNKEIIKELSRLFCSKVELISGPTSKEKRFLIKRLKKAEAEKLLQENLINTMRF